MLPHHLQLWVNLSMLSSSRAAASNAHQWAFCAMARDSTHYPSFKFSKTVIYGVDPILEFGPWIWPGGAGGVLPQSLLWLGAFLPKPEAFLNGVQNFLADPLLHLHITRWPPSWYTSLYTPLISSLVNLGPMSSMADDSTSRSHSGKGCPWPQQMAQSCSFLLVTTSCTEGMGSGICEVPNVDIHPGRCQHQAAFPPLV